MNISYWIKNPDKIFGALLMTKASCFLSDEKCIQLCYKLNTGSNLNLDAPKTLNEKIQWLKLYDRNPLFTDLADKSKAYQFAKEIGKEYIYVVPQFGKWKHFNDINFAELPDQFVLKCNHDSGSVVICKDIKCFNKKKAKAKLDKKLKRNFYWFGRQYHYKNIEPWIIAEKYMAELSDDMTDYKFLCFNGEPMVLYIAQGMDNHSTGRLSYFDINKNKLPFKLADYPDIEDNFQWPACYDTMVRFARDSAKAMKAKFVRVDLYEVSGKVYFSEYTFYPTNGYQMISPIEYDEWLGSMLTL